MDPDKEYKNIEQKLPIQIQTTPPSVATRKKDTKTLKELVKQRRRVHCTGKKYDLPKATHRYNARAQGTRVEPMAQHVAILERNIQVHHQENVVIDPTSEVNVC